MKKFLCLILCCAICCSLPILVSCTSNDNNVVIYSSMEDFRNEKLAEILKSELPNIKVDIQYLPSGTNAAKLKAEKTDIGADIILDIDFAYMESLKENFAINSNEIANNFLDDYVPLGKEYLPLSKFSVGIIINKSIFKEKQLAIPTTYADLIKSEYKDLISMPNPTASGTGYAFLKGMVNLLGEDNAYQYFESLQKNIKQFTSSGSGPVNGLVRGEVAIGIGMVFQAVQEINKGANLEVLNFSEGLAYNLSGCAMIKGREKNENVVKVFEVFVNKYLPYDKINFLPEKIFKNQEPTIIKNYPENLSAINMEGINDSNEKVRLLSKWKY